MKKFLQACEIGGSLYGKRRVATRRENGSVKKSETMAEKDRIAAYNRFYKNQLAAMDKVFHRGR